MDECERDEMGACKTNMPYRRMRDKFLTKEVLKKLKPFGSTNNTPFTDIRPPLKLFNPCGAATWWIWEYDGEDTLYGIADLGIGFREVGTVSLSELESIKCPPFGLGIERDKHWRGDKTAKEIFDEGPA